MTPHGSLKGCGRGNPVHCGHLWRGRSAVRARLMQKCKVCCVAHGYVGACRISGICFILFSPMRLSYEVTDSAYPILTPPLEVFSGFIAVYAISLFHMPFWGTG